MENGRQKNFLKILWYTPKDRSIYWPYNFLVMRKRIYDYPEQFALWNYVSSMGAFLSIWVLCFPIGIVFYTLIWGKKIKEMYIHPNMYFP